MPGKETCYDFERKDLVFKTKNKAKKNLFFNAVRQENPMRKENKEPVRSGLKKLLGFVYTEFGQTASYKQKKGAVLCKNKRIKSRLYTQM